MKFLSFCILVFFSSTLFAQVNIERYNNLSSIDGLMGNVSFYISSKTGNTDIQEFEIDGRVNYKGENFFSFLITQIIEQLCLSPKAPPSIADGLVNSFCLNSYSILILA